MSDNKPFMLMILDGWGINLSSKGNAVAQANMPYLNRLSQTFPRTQLLCSGEAVGLPEGIMGNSEVGHLNIGAGRIVYQDLLRIDTAIKDLSFFKNRVLNEAYSVTGEKDAGLHLMGLISDGGVHSQLTHLFALLKLAAEKGLKKVYIHAILDGRDTPPDAGVEYIRQLQKYLDNNNTGRIATICGRFYAMDRDTRWDRTEKAFHLYTEGKGLPEKDPVIAVLNAYKRGETDEFIKPIIIHPEGTVRDNDSIVFFNFRADRARQITRAFTDPEFREFLRRLSPTLSKYICMTVYDELFTLPVAFPPQHLKGILGEVISRKGLSQLRIAETEKYAHVTYFFNGGEEKPFQGEDRCLIPSPREVSTYDQKPEMSANQVGDEVISRIRTGRYDLIVLNFANMDMVGHTGILNAAIKACEVVDANIEKIVSEILSREGTAIITADHGNAEQMIDAAGNPHTAHTLNPVPLLLVNDKKKSARLRKGILGDIAPTILELMKIEKPTEMTCRSLIEKK